MRSRIAGLLGSIGAAASLSLLACSGSSPDAPSVVATPAEPVAKPTDTLPHGQLAFVGAGARIHLVNADGSGDIAITAGPVVSVTYYSKPAWSPDGQFIAFSAPGVGVPSGDTLYIIRPPSPNAIRLGVGTRPAWRPGR